MVNLATNADPFTLNSDITTFDSPIYNSDTQDQSLPQNKCSYALYMNSKRRRLSSENYTKSNHGHHGNYEEVSDTLSIGSDAAENMPQLYEFSCRDMFPPASACAPPRSMTSDLKSSSLSVLNTFSLSNLSPMIEPSQVATVTPTDSTNFYEMSNTTSSSIVPPTRDNSLISYSTFSTPIDVSISGPVNHYVADNFPLVRKKDFGPKSYKKSTRAALYDPNYNFLECELSSTGSDYKTLCMNPWTGTEQFEMRRIVRIEKFRNLNKFQLHFSVVNTENERADSLDMDGKPYISGDIEPQSIDVSCLECQCAPGDDGLDHSHKRFYITSVEVIRIVELMIYDRGSTTPNYQKRRERGRVRSNLLPFWSKSINSKKDSSASLSPCSRRSVSTSSPFPLDPESPHIEPKTEDDCKQQLAQRIMSYQTRKPRGFDKDVRILEWNKLMDALTRVMQSYYVKVPKEYSPS